MICRLACFPPVPAGGMGGSGRCGGQAYAREKHKTLRDFLAFVSGV